MIPALRTLFGILGLCGCWFARLAWAFVLLPIGIIMPECQYTFHDVIMSLSGCGLALSGYFVWINWLTFAATGRFVGASAVTVQAVSFLHHLGWLVWLFLPALGKEPLLDAVSRVPIMPLECAWIVVNVVVALATGLCFLVVGEVITEPSDGAG